MRNPESLDQLKSLDHSITGKATDVRLLTERKLAISTLFSQYIYVFNTQRCLRLAMMSRYFFSRRKWLTFSVFCIDRHDYKTSPAICSFSVLYLQTCTVYRLQVVQWFELRTTITQRFSQKARCARCSMHVHIQYNFFSLRAVHVCSLNPAARAVARPLVPGWRQPWRQPSVL